MIIKRQRDRALSLPPPLAFNITLKRALHAYPIAPQSFPILVFTKFTEERNFPLKKKSVYNNNLFL